MQNAYDKTDTFLKAIQKYADSQRKQIQSEIASFKEQELKKAEEQGIKDAAELIRKEKESVRMDIIGGLVQREEESKKALFEKRCEITNQVFAAAQEKIIEFCTGDKYPDMLKHSAKKIADYIKNESPTVFISPKDKKFINDINLIFDGKCTIEVSDDIKLGGIRALYKDSGIMLDDTLDSRFEQQRICFTKTSGLKVFTR